MSSDEELLVFGYASRIYSPDERSDFIAEEQHLIVSPERCILTNRQIRLPFAVTGGLRCLLFRPQVKRSHVLPKISKRRCVMRSVTEICFGTHRC
ncbi:hypothetical protein KIN20_014375, partial [Parelaphostrongylus tenuis]